MEINYINEFVVLVETGNFMEAAERLYISQSSLSKHIKNIELELGEKLFDRTTRKVELSDFGKSFYPYANKIVDIQKEYTSVLFSKFENLKMSLTLGSIPSMVQYGITDVIANFKKNNPNFTLTVIQNESDKLEDMLRKNKCELAFIRQLDNTENEFVEIPFMQDTMVAVLPITHPLANEKEIKLEQLEKEDFLLLPKHTRPYNLYIKACEDRGFKPKVIFTDRQLENIIDLVEKGMGVSLLMKKLAIYLKSPQFVFIDISPNVTANVSLCYKKGAKLSSNAKYFIDYVIKNFINKNSEL